eukprot:scaffold4047_cov135-Alexandrium_tamarense.AAC.6
MHRRRASDMDLNRRSSSRGRSTSSAIGHGRSVKWNEVERGPDDTGRITSQRRRARSVGRSMTLDDRRELRDAERVDRCGSIVRGGERDHRRQRDSQRRDRDGERFKRNEDIGRHQRISSHTPLHSSMQDVRTSYTRDFRNRNDQHHSSLLTLQETRSRSRSAMRGRDDDLNSSLQNVFGYEGRSASRSRSSSRTRSASRPRSTSNSRMSHREDSLVSRHRSTSSNTRSSSEAAAQCALSSALSNFNLRNDEDDDDPSLRVPLERRYSSSDGRNNSVGRRSSNESSNNYNDSRNQGSNERVTSVLDQISSMKRRSSTGCCTTPKNKTPSRTAKKKNLERALSQGSIKPTPPSNHGRQRKESNFDEASSTVPSFPPSQLKSLASFTTATISTTASSSESSGSRSSHAEVKTPLSTKSPTLPIRSMTTSVQSTPKSTPKSFSAPGCVVDAYRQFKSKSAESVGRPKFQPPIKSNDTNATNSFTSQQFPPPPPPSYRRRHSSDACTAPKTSSSDDVISPTSTLKPLDWNSSSPALLGNTSPSTNAPPTTGGIGLRSNNSGVRMIPPPPPRREKFFPLPFETSTDESEALLRTSRPPCRSILALNAENSISPMNNAATTTTSAEQPAPRTNQRGPRFGRGRSLTRSTTATPTPAEREVSPISVNTCGQETLTKRIGERSKKVDGMPHTDQFGDAGLYTGEVNDDKRPHGKGKMKYENGVFYEGKWVNGAQDSTGVLQRERMLSGFTSWRGRSKSRERGGLGGCTVYGMEWIDFSGMAGRYTGTVNEDNLPEGKGIMKYDFGLIAEGEWVKGVLNNGSSQGQIAGGATVMGGTVMGGGMSVAPGAGMSVVGGSIAPVSVMGMGGISVAPPNPMHHPQMMMQPHPSQMNQYCLPYAYDPSRMG